MSKGAVRLLLRHLAIFAAVAIYIMLSLKFRIYCPIKRLIGFTCPACGATRAMFALFRGDIAKYIEYNPFALPIGAVVLIAPHLNKFGKFKRPLLALCILAVFGAFIYNLKRTI